MNPFPWHPVGLGVKLALAPHGWFEPVLEWYTPPSDFSHGTYFGLARTEDADDRCGYLATQDFHGEFRECEFPLKDLEALEKTLKEISIPLGSSVGASHGGSGLIRIYHGREGWIDFFYRNIEQPQWDPLLAFIRKRPNGSCRPRPLRCRGTSLMLPARGSPDARPWKKNAHCAGSLMIQILARF